MPRPPLREKILREFSGGVPEWTALRQTLQIRKMAGADHPGPGLGLKIIEFHPLKYWNFFEYVHMCQRWQVSLWPLDRPKIDWSSLYFSKSARIARTDFPTDNDVSVVLQLSRFARATTRRKLYQYSLRSIHPKGVCFFSWRNYGKHVRDYVSELQHHFKYVRLYKETGTKMDLDLICVAECRIPI